MSKGSEAGGFHGLGLERLFQPTLRSSPGATAELPRWPGSHHLIVLLCRSTYKFEDQLENVLPKSIMSGHQESISYYVLSQNVPYRHSKNDKSLTPRGCS